MKCHKSLVQVPHQDNIWCLVWGLACCSLLLVFLEIPTAKQASVRVLPVHGWADFRQAVAGQDNTRSKRDVLSLFVSPQPRGKLGVRLGVPGLSQAFLGSEGYGKR